MLLVFGGLAGCSSSSSVEPVCVAGITQSCLCVGGGTGVQSCKDDGSGFGACDCGSGSGVDATTDSPADAVDSPSDDSADSAVADTHSTETGSDAMTSGKFSGATGAAWELRTGGVNGPQGFSEYSPPGSSYFFATYSVSGVGTTSQFARYDVASDSWTSLAANPWGVEYWKGLGWMGTSLYQAKDNFMVRYAIADNTWTMVANGLPGTASSMHVHDDGHTLYTMATDGTNKIVVFDTVASTASYVAGPTGTVYHPRLGWDGATKALYIAPSADLTSLWSYTPTTGAVTERAPIPETSVGIAFCSDRGGHLYATGDNTSCSTSKAIWQYDTVANSWKKIPDLPFAHGCNGACTVTDDGWLFVSDGYGKLARLKLL